MMPKFGNGNGNVHKTYNLYNPLIELFKGEKVFEKS
jgi:hypothetical protein